MPGGRSLTDKRPQQSCINCGVWFIGGKSEDVCGVGGRYNQHIWSSPFCALLCHDEMIIMNPFKVASDVATACYGVEAIIPIPLQAA